MVLPPDIFNTLCDAVALCYHESRNARHLVNKDFLNCQPWRFVVSLPTNRDIAWREIVPLRDKASAARDVNAALKVFETRFQVSLQELQAMFGNENWRHAKLYGGNAWEEIVKLVLQLADALRADDASAARQFETQLKTARHNTGSVQEKIARLEKRRAESEESWN
jgi:cell division septum initiation protein DivIVA